MVGVEYGQQCFYDTRVSPSAARASAMASSHVHAARLRLLLALALPSNLYLAAAARARAPGPPQPFVCTVTRERGCYKDGGAASPGVLAHQIGGNSEQMTKEYCAGLVAEHVGVEGMAGVVVGVEYGQQCFYDARVSPSAARASASDCGMQCPGTVAKETCGGSFRLEAFQASCVRSPPRPPYPPGPLPSEGPCDILGAAGNPCVAAHSTTRALYSAYNGALYSVTRLLNQSSVPESTSIRVLAPGGFADAPAQDRFCAAALTCVIGTVFDQSPLRNHLGKRHQLVDATRHRITVGPERVPVYGMWFDPGVSCVGRAPRQSALALSPVWCARAFAPTVHPPTACSS